MRIQWIKRKGSCEPRHSTHNSGRHRGLPLLTLNLILGVLLLLSVLILVPGFIQAQEETVPPATTEAAPVEEAADAQEAAPASDPSGATTGGINDVPAATPGKPTLEEVAATAGHNKVSINIVWTLLTGYLVMFMAAGFALVETGFTRKKNAAHTMTMNLMAYGIAMLGYWICGFAFQMGGVGAIAALGGTPPLTGEWTITLFGKDFGLIGTKGFFLSGDTYDVGVFALFLFQYVFMTTACTIVTGAMSERWKFLAYCVYAFFIAIWTYPIYANWMWGGGWLATMGKNFGLGHGAVDFAGSGVVHMVGGWTALAGAWLIGPRIGKYKPDGTPNAIPGHNIPMAILGTLILAFGWFGFNPGSTLAGTDLRISVVAVNTMLASAAGAFAAMVWIWTRSGKPDPGMIANGMLAGLVAITAPCAFVNSVSAVIIGLVAGFLVVESVFFLERVLKVDDPVGAISVHGAGGAWGVLSLGLLADGTYGDGWNGVSGTVRGLFYGDASQFAAQFIDVIVNFSFVFGSAWVFFKVMDALVGNRVSAAEEIEGLDIGEMGVSAYAESPITPSSEHGS